MDKEHSKIEEGGGGCQERKEKQTEQMFWGRRRAGGKGALMVRGQWLYHGGGERLSPLG